MKIDNSVDPRTHLKRLIEHEDLVILSVNDRQGLKKQWIEKENMYMN